MTLTVEDGTGLDDADALISLAFANSYHSAMGGAAWTGDDEGKEAAIRRASRHVSDAYKWVGLPRRPRIQAFAWPRSNVTDADGYAVPYDEVPDEIQRAVAMVALAELETPGAMSPTFNASEAVTREKFGPIEFEYAATNTSASSVRPVLLGVRDVVGGFLAAGSSGIAGRVYR